MEQAATAAQPMTYAEAWAAADFPTLRAEGIAAFRAGVSSYDCPYPYGTVKGDIWWGGFFDASSGRA